MEEFLADTMDQELHAELEDGSERQVAALLLRYAELNRAGKHAELSDEVEKKLGAKKQSQAQASVKLKQDQDADEVWEHYKLLELIRVVKIGISKFFQCRFSS